MRSFLVSGVVAMVVTTMAASGSAEEKIATRPKIELAPPVRIVGFHRSGPNGVFTGGALGIAVDVENKGAATADGVIVKIDVGGQVLASTIAIPAGAMRTVTFNDANGLASSCKVNAYAISLAGPATGDATRAGRITPSCTFKSSVEETWNQMTPDHVEANKAGNAYLTAPTLVNAPVCGAGPTIKVRIVNKSTLSSPSIVVQAKEWTAAAPVRAQTAAAFAIAPNESKDLVLTPVGSAGSDVPAKLGLHIVDWTKSLGGHTSDGGIFVNTSRTCTLDFDLL